MTGKVQLCSQLHGSLSQYLLKSDGDPFSTVEEEEIFIPAGVQSILLFKIHLFLTAR